MPTRGGSIGAKSSFVPPSVFVKRISRPYSHRVDERDGEARRAFAASDRAEAVYGGGLHADEAGCDVQRERDLLRHLRLVRRELRLFEEHRRVDGQDTEAGEHRTDPDEDVEARRLAPLRGVR